MQTTSSPVPPPSSPAALSVDRLVVRYGELTALDEVSLSIAAGTVLGVLGHNGSGKTSLVRAVCGVVAPQGGSVRVCGTDVARDPRGVRARLGVVGQEAAVDGTMTGRANLELIARLLGAGRSEARTRGEELLAAMALTDHADRPVREYSGGMRRRLDLACALVGRPGVLLLDEPSTGLDPASRETLWELVRGRVAEGAAVLITTQYLEEADRLADQLTVLANGRTVETGTPAALKELHGRRSARVELGDTDLPGAVRDLLRASGFRAIAGPGRVDVALTGGAAITDLVRALDASRVVPRALQMREPTLDDVYLAVQERHRAAASGAAR